MKKPLIIANWKMNPATLKGAKLLFDSVKRGVGRIKKAEVVICPPFVYLPIANNKSSMIKLGAQDCFWKEKGAYTGEVSAKMLKNSGCRYVILGHSERRKYFNETGEIINKKIKIALKEKIIPILCVGESEKERAKGKTANVLKKQITSALKNISGPKFSASGIIIAYEPNWAIGSGNSCDFNETQIMGLLIRKIIANLYSRRIAESFRVIYGGSVNCGNAEAYIKEAGINGLLIGGASLNSKEFIKIVKSIS